MPKRVWKKGPPPHVGWWNASISRDVYAWRWWDGKQWSFALFPHSSARAVAEDSQQPTTEINSIIEWSDYWPENARVPRVDPTKKGLLKAGWVDWALSEAGWALSGAGWELSDLVEHQKQTIADQAEIIKDFGAVITRLKTELERKNAAIADLTRIIQRRNNDGTAEDKALNKNIYCIGTSRVDLHNGLGLCLLDQEP